MKHYTDTISADLAEKLKEKGMPMNLWEGVGKYMEQLESTVEMRDGFYLGTFKNTILYQLPTYAEVFDWLLNLGYDVEVYLSMTKRSKADGTTKRLYAWIVNAPNQVNEATSRDEEYYTWHEAANAAIEKALTLI